MKHYKLITAALFTMILAGTVSASPAELRVFPDQSSTEVNSYTAFEVEIENTGAVSDRYSLSSSAPNEVTIAPDNVPQQGNLEPGETETAQVWYNPDVGQEAGVYSFTVTATSRASGEKYSVDATVEVIKDHQVDVNVVDTQSGCLGETTRYTVEVTNNGIQQEEFSLTTRAGSLNQQTVTLAPGETQEVTLTVSSDTAGEQNFNVVAASTTSYAQDIESVSYVTEVCYDGDVQVQPQSKDAAAFTESEFNVTVRNTGTRNNTWNLNSNVGNFDDTNLEIEGESSETATLTLEPEQLGTQNIEVTARSDVGNIERRGTATLNVRNGMSSTVEFTDDAPAVCESEEFDIEAEITNDGEADETFELSTSRGELSEDELSLDAGESEDVDVEIDSSNMSTGDYTVNLTSTATTFGEPVTISSTDFTVENCWDLEMTVNPEISSAGENMSTVYQVDLTNPGTQENTYEVSIEEGPEWVSVRPQEVTVAPGETEQAFIYAGVPFGKQSGELTITARAEGTDVEENRSVQLVIGEELEEAIESEEGGNGSFAPSLPQLPTGDAVSAVSSSVGKIVASILIGLAITAGVLYHEW
jgi:hypothetical protein